MPLASQQRPLQGALFFLVCTAAVASPAWAQVPSAASPSPASASPEALRAHGVADQLIGYLRSVLAWDDRPDQRATPAAISPTLIAAVNRHPEARIAAEQRQTSAYATREAYAGYLPQISANVEGGKRSNDPVSTPWSSVPAYEDNSRAVSLVGRQLLYDFGATSGQIQAKQAMEAAVQFRAQAKRSELTLRALAAWLEVFRTRSHVRAAQMNVLSRQQLLSFIQEREQLGASSAGDVLRARARLADAQAAAVQARSRLSVAEAVYVEFFNQAAPEQLSLPQSPEVDLKAFADLRPWLNAHPQLAEIQRQIDAAQAESQAARAALLPSVSVDVNVRRRDLRGAGVPGTDWTAGLAVRQNLYAGGADQARASQAEQRVREAQLNRDNVRQQLERLLSQTVADVDNAVLGVRSRKESAQVAASAFEAVREQFAFRRGSLLDVLRAQEELHQATRDLIDSLVDETSSRYRLLHLASRLTPLFGVPADAPEPAVPGSPVPQWLPRLGKPEAPKPSP